MNHLWNDIIWYGENDLTKYWNAIDRLTAYKKWKGVDGPKSTAKITSRGETSLEVFHLTGFDYLN